MGNEKISKSAKQKLLVTEIGKNLDFDDHVITLC